MAKKQAPQIVPGPSSAKEQLAIKAQLIEEAKIRQEINSGLDSYLEHLEKIKSLNNTIKENDKILLKLQDSMNVATGAEKKLIQEKIELLKKVNEELGIELDKHKKIAKEAKVGNLLMGKMLGSMAKGLAKLPGTIKSLYGDIKGSGLFEMDKAIKQSGLQMGILGTQSKLYQATIREAALTTNELGMGVKELAEMQAAYSEELGRAVQLGQKGLEAMSEMAAATALGADGAAKMSAEMDTQGYSAERTRDFIQQTMDDSTKMGLNASKVVKNMQNGMKMLNKYNFKDGVKGLAKMAKTVAKLGVDMSVAAGMADKLFDIEGAVDMSSQLQVMGGAWAQLADPFKLMYMARNDMEGLTEALGQAAESSVNFNNKNKDFEISALEMHRLRKVAEQTGVSYEDLAEMGKKAAKATRIQKQMSWSIDPEMKDFLVNQAQWNEKGEATIQVNGSTKLLKELSSSDKTLLKNQMQETETLKERARNAQDFDTKLTNLINMMKTTLLPVVDGLNTVLGPLVKDLFANKTFKDEMKAFGVKLGHFVEGAAKIGKWIAEAAVWLGPTGTLATIFGAKVLFNVGQWLLNGMMLARGFNMGASINPAGGVGSKAYGPQVPGGGAFGTTQGASMGSNFNAAAGSKLLKLGGVVAGLTSAITTFTSNKQKGMGTGENLARSGTKGVGAGLGAWGGAAAGAAIGSAVPIIGTVIGGLIGGALGAWGGGALAEGGANALVAPSVKDAILSGGKLTPIDKKDDLVAYKPNGPVDNAIKGSNSSNGGTMKIEFGEIHFKFDELKVTSPGSPGVAVELIKDPKFIRDITRMIHVETEKVVNGGKNK